MLLTIDLNNHELHIPQGRLGNLSKTLGWKYIEVSPSDVWRATVVPQDLPRKFSRSKLDFSQYASEIKQAVLQGVKDKPFSLPKEPLVNLVHEVGEQLQTHPELLKKKQKLAKLRLVNEA